MSIAGYHRAPREKVHEPTTTCGVTKVGSGRTRFHARAWYSCAHGTPERRGSGRDPARRRSRDPRAHPAEVDPPASRGPGGADARTRDNGTAHGDHSPSFGP